MATGAKIALSMYLGTYCTPYNLWTCWKAVSALRHTTNRNKRRKKFKPKNEFDGREMSNQCNLFKSLIIFWLSLLLLLRRIDCSLVGQNGYHHGATIQRLQIWRWRPKIQDFTGIERTRDPDSNSATIAGRRALSCRRRANCACVSINSGFFISAQLEI